MSSGNWSTSSGQSGLMILVPQSNGELNRPSLQTTTPTAAGKDDLGAGYYVIVVILVYGMSIVALIASHIKRKHSKLLEDRQIHKYLKEFQVVRETSSRDTYRSLKRSIVDKLSRGGGNETSAAHSSTGARGGRRRSSSGCSSTSGSSIHRCLSRAVLPMTAPLGLAANVCSIDLVDEDEASQQRRRLPVGGRQRNESGYATDGPPVAVGSSRHRLERRRHALRVVSPMTLPRSPPSVCQDGDASGRNSPIDRDHRRQVVDELDLTYVPVARFLNLPAMCRNCQMQLVDCSQLCPASTLDCPDIDTRRAHVVDCRAHPVFVEDATLTVVNHVAPSTTRGGLKSATGRKDSRPIPTSDDRRVNQSTSCRPCRPQLLDLTRQVDFPPSSTSNRRNSAACRHTDYVVRDVIVPAETPMTADCFDRSSATTISSSLLSGDIQPAAAPAVHVTSL